MKQLVFVVDAVVVVTVVAETVVVIVADADEVAFTKPDTAKNRIVKKI